MTADLVIVGAGIGGSALAAQMAARGAEVLVLERETVYRDRVRGEWMAPWGVREAMQLGLYPLLREAGAHHLSRHWSLHDRRDASAPPDAELALDAFVPGVPGPLTIGHPTSCSVLSAHAERAGARVLRGVEDVRIEAGREPAVRFVHDGVATRVACRLIVGADGRGSSVRRQAGIAVHRDPTHHLFAGLLVDGAHAWPEDLQAIGVEGDVHFLVFPQGRGRVRLYLGYGLEQKDRLAGAGAEQRFLDAFRLPGVRFSDALAGATPAGPCHSYGNEDAWTESPAAPGVVLIGDAAGNNDPIIGQGLSITLRDVRLVSEALAAHAAWGPEAFADYATERRERMRRLRFSAAVTATLENEFGPEAAARRRLVRRRQEQDPVLLLNLAAAFAGPEAMPAEAFDESVRTRLFAAA